MKQEKPTNTFCGQTTRREFFHQISGGFASLALTGILGADGFFSSQTLAADGVASWKNPLAPKPPHHKAKAKSVIFLFMYGGPSHVDTFDYKPELYPLDGKTVEVKTFGRGGHKNQGRVVGPKWKFKQYGQCGKWISDLFPHLAGHVDDMAFLHSMTAESPIHGSAMLMMNTGNLLSGRPSLGSWKFTMWMAGGGVQGGQSVGETDELGGRAVRDRLQVKNLHATILNQMGLNPEQLTYFYAGLDQKLVGVEGAEPIHAII